MIKVEISFKRTNFLIETNWESPITDLKNKLQKIDKDCVPKYIGLKVDRGPIINDNQTVGDACLTYYYLNSNNKDNDKVGKDKIQPRFIATVNIEKVQNYNPTCQSPSYVSKNSLKILRNAGKLYQGKDYFNTFIQYDNDKKFELNKIRSNEVEKYKLRQSKSKMNKKSIEIMSTKVSEDLDIYDKLFKDKGRKADNLKKLTESYFKISPYHPKQKLSSKKMLKDRSESACNIFDKLFKDQIKYDNKKIEMKKNFYKEQDERNAQKFVTNPELFKTSEKLSKRLNNNCYYEILYEGGYEGAKARNRAKEEMWIKHYLNDDVCSFSPKIKKHYIHRKFHDVELTSDKIIRMSTPKELKRPYKDPECTFKPKLNRLVQSVINNDK